MSCAAISLNARIIPSTTTKGDPGLLMEAPPLSKIKGEAPGEPVEFTTCKPEMVPCNAPPIFERGVVANTS